VRPARSEPWGPSGTVLHEISSATTDSQQRMIIIQVLYERLKEPAANWKKVTPPCRCRGPPVPWPAGAGARRRRLGSLSSGLFPSLPRCGAAAFSGLPWEEEEAGSPRTLHGGIFSCLVVVNTLDLLLSRFNRVALNKVWCFAFKKVWCFAEHGSVLRCPFFSNKTGVSSEGRSGLMVGRCTQG